MNDQENIKRIQARESEMERLQEWEEIYREMAEGSGEPPINPKKVEQPTPMAQVLNNLKDTLKEQEKALADYQDNTVETEAEWITLGWTEALTFALQRIEETMEQSQKAEAVNKMTNYLLTGDRGQHGTEKPN